jgi:nucleotide-binding universal stress UspA family protein
VFDRILVAVDDSPASFAAARVAAALAAALGARVRVVHVAVDHQLGEAVSRVSEQPHVHTRILEGRRALLTRVSSLTTSAGVEPEAVLLTGSIAPVLIGDAHAWGANLVVVGKSARAVVGDPYIGSQTRQLLEFAEWPVLVVPPPGP